MPAHEDRHVEMRRLHAALRRRHAAGLDRAEPKCALIVGRHAAEASEAGSSGMSRAVVGMGIAAVRVRLPDFDESVGDGLAVAVDDAAFDRDFLAAGSPAPARSSVTSHVSPMCRYGPTVCDDVVSRLMVFFQVGRKVICPSAFLHGRAARCRIVAQRLLREWSCPSRTPRPGAGVPAHRECSCTSGRIRAADRPGKYICVTRRVANAGPNSEKWMCAGRHAL